MVHEVLGTASEGLGSCRRATLLMASQASFKCVLLWTPLCGVILSAVWQRCRGLTSGPHIWGKGVGKVAMAIHPPYVLSAKGLLWGRVRPGVGCIDIVICNEIAALCGVLQ